MFVRTLAAVVAAALAVSACAKWASHPRFGSLKSDRRKFEFSHNIELVEVTNGMKVALIRDTRTNLVTVDVRYEVGSAEDPVGRAGLAHLVEHLVFEVRAQTGGPTLADDLSELALSYNAWTRPDETHYTTTAPAANLDALIALEARRMKITCDQLDEATFARERDVVLSEEAERSDALEGTRRSLYAAIYGEDHPYTRAMQRGEIAQATRAEACAFIAEHYTPDRAILVVTGPIDPKRATAVIGPIFGPIPRGGTYRPELLPLTRLAGSSEHTGAIDHPILVITFPRPAWGARGHVAAELVEAQLGDAISAAAEGTPWIRTTSVGTIGDSRAPALSVFVELSDDRHVAEATRLVFAAAAKLAAEGEPVRLVARRRGAMSLAVVAAWDRIGARGARIADYLQYTDHYLFMLQDMAELNRLTTRELSGLAGDLTGDSAHVALVRPDPGAGPTAALTLPPLQSHDLQPWRTPVDPAEAHRPLTADPTHPSDHIDANVLANGLRVVLAPDPASPIVDARLVFPGGTAHEPRDRPGLAIAAAYLLNHDHEGFYLPHEVERLEWAVSLGTQPDTDVDETTTTFSVRGLGFYADWHVWQLSWLLDKGVYNWDAIEAMRAMVRKADETDETDETDQGILRFRQRLFGKGHPYATPPYSSKALLQIGRPDLERWKRDHYRARGATLIISGAFEKEAMRTVVSELFGPWSDAAPADLPPVPQPTPRRGPSWLAVRDADMVQARITIGFQSRSHPSRDEAAREVLTRILEDRLRLVREGMGASYGVDVRYQFGAGGGALVITGLVDGARTGEVLARVLAELDAVRAGGGTFDVDFVRARRRALTAALAYAGGASAIANTVERLAARELGIDHAVEVAERIARLTPEAVAALAAADLATTQQVVQVAGKADAVDAAFTAVGQQPE